MVVFDPYYLKPLATLNQRVVVSLPGIDQGLVGKTGYTVASQPALIELMREHGRELRFERISEIDYPKYLNDLLNSSDSELRIASYRIAKTHGQRLGYLLASVLLSEQYLTDPIDPWEEAYLAHWREQVECLFLGGGLANGSLGLVICKAVSEVFERCNLSIHLEVADHPSHLPLIGAARRQIGKPGNVAIVADFGGSYAKRGMAHYDSSGSLLSLEILPSVSISLSCISENASRLASKMVKILVDMVRSISNKRSLIPKILVCLAAYVQDGKPLKLDRGGYYALNQISDDICAWFSERISKLCGREIEVEFLHDCDAAAGGLAGREKAAVIMLGSALGVGFVPPENVYRAMVKSPYIFARC